MGQKILDVRDTLFQRLIEPELLLHERKITNISELSREPISLYKLFVPQKNSCKRGSTVLSDWTKIFLIQRMAIACRYGAN